MTETDIPYKALPKAIKSAIETGRYAGWRVDDIDMIERPDTGTVYVINVEKGHDDMELHYTQDGTLVKEIVD